MAKDAGQPVENNPPPGNATERSEPKRRPVPIPLGTIGRSLTFVIEKDETTEESDRVAPPVPAPRGVVAARGAPADSKPVPAPRRPRARDQDQAAEQLQAAAHPAKAEDKPLLKEDSFDGARPPSTRPASRRNQLLRQRAFRPASPHSDSSSDSAPIRSAGIVIVAEVHASDVPTDRSEGTQDLLHNRIDTAVLEEYQEPGQDGAESAHEDKQDSDRGAQELQQASAGNSGDPPEERLPARNGKGGESQELEQLTAGNNKDGRPQEPEQTPEENSKDGGLQELEQPPQGNSTDEKLQQLEQTPTGISKDEELKELEQTPAGNETNDALQESEQTGNNKFGVLIEELEQPPTENCTDDRINAHAEDAVAGNTIDGQLEVLDQAESNNTNESIQEKVKQATSSIRGRDEVLQQPPAERSRDVLEEETPADGLPQGPPRQRGGREPGEAVVIDGPAGADDWQLGATARKSRRTPRKLHAMDRDTLSRLQAKIKRKLEETQCVSTSKEALQLELEATSAALRKFYSSPASEAEQLLREGRQLVQRMRALREAVAGVSGEGELDGATSVGPKEFASALSCLFTTGAEFTTLST